MAVDGGAQIDTPYPTHDTGRHHAMDVEEEAVHHIHVVHLCAVREVCDLCSHGELASAVGEQEVAAVAAVVVEEEAVAAERVLEPSTGRDGAFDDIHRYHFQY